MMLHFLLNWETKARCWSNGNITIYSSNGLISFSYVTRSQVFKYCMLVDLHTILVSTLKAHRAFSQDLHVFDPV